MSKILLLAGTLLMISKALSFYNKSHDGYIFILPDNIDKDPPNSKPMRLSFSDAQQWCTKTVAGSTLATIRNKDIQRNVAQFIRSALQDNNWQDLFSNIRLNGKYHMTDDWHWLNGHPKAADLKVDDQTDESYEFYARVKNLGIYSTTANKIGRFICEYPDNSERCSDSRALLNERCYKKNTTSLTWYDARNNCLERGGDLASFESLSDMNINALLRNLSLYSDTEHWIGLRKIQWLWKDTDTINSSTPLNDISSTNNFVIIIASCSAVIFIAAIIIVVAVFIAKKRRNSDAPRSVGVKSSAFENVNEYSVTNATKDFQVYAEVQEPNASNFASNTTYAKVEMAANTNEDLTVNGIVYAELDLTSRP